ncbi:MAG: hypothetical protein AAF802_24140 [Planctomycetota bacterium]
MESPLDRLEPETTVLTAVSQPTARAAKRRHRPGSVGRMRVHFRRDPRISEADFRRTRRRQVTVELLTASSSPVYLLGTLASFNRPGLVQIKLPPASDWNSAVAKLPKPARCRVGQPEFYETLQRLITSRFLSEERKSQLRQ